MFHVSNERICAQNFTDSLKSQLQNSRVHHSWYETPFQVQLNIKKRYLTEKSKTVVRESSSVTFHDVAIQKYDNKLSVIKKELTEAKLKLKEKDKKIVELGSDLDDKQKESKAQDERISVLSKDLDDKRKVLKEKEEIIEGYRKYSEVRRREFEKEKDVEITEINKDYAKSLSTKDKKITQLSKDLDMKRTESNYKDTQITELGKVLNEKRKESKEKGDQITELRKVLEMERKELKERDKEISELSHDLDMERKEESDKIEENVRHLAWWKKVARKFQKRQELRQKSANILKYHKIDDDGRFCFWKVPVKLAKKDEVEKTEKEDEDDYERGVDSAEERNVKTELEEN